MHIYLKEKGQNNMGMRCMFGGVLFNELDHFTKDATKFSFPVFWQV